MAARSVVGPRHLQLTCPCPASPAASVRGVQVETISPSNVRTFSKRGCPDECGSESQTIFLDYAYSATGHPGIYPTKCHSCLRCGASETGMTGTASSLNSPFLDVPWRDGASRCAHMTLYRAFPDVPLHSLYKHQPD
uniref:Uncharacterized protein n=2 Tax=Canis lupus familiaris TaxID=9615 RepID=A0A8C0PKL4_CANLF